MESWRGDELDKLVDENRDLSLEKIKALIGREADIDVVLIDNDRDTQFRHIHRILPPGTLVDDNQLGAAA